MSACHPGALHRAAARTTPAVSSTSHSSACVQSSVLDHRLEDAWPGRLDGGRLGERGGDRELAGAEPLGPLAPGHVLHGLDGAERAAVRAEIGWASMR